ncbi:hypothetical protein F4778DRAFT_343209 [Xylariomycetidae sp. FL2044]|nr:hypothetical protein F4778DRAFT_343209 [Xylariomycetidae sp. FL2044]
MNSSGDKYDGKVADYRIWYEQNKGFRVGAVALAEVFEGAALAKTPQTPKGEKNKTKCLKRIIDRKSPKKTALRPMTTRGGKIGMISRNGQPGDKVCVLFGCSVPVILGRVMNVASDEYEMVGECYLYGFMNGEILSHEGSKEEVFTFSVGVLVGSPYSGAMTTSMMALAWCLGADRHNATIPQ